MKPYIVNFTENQKIINHEKDLDVNQYVRFVIVGL